MQDSLEKLVGDEGVSGCMIITKGGLILDNAGQSNLNLTSLAAISSSALVSAEEIGETAKIGILQQQILEFDDGKAVIQQINSELVLLVIATDKANLGIIRHTVDKILNDLKSSLN